MSDSLERARVESNDGQPLPPKDALIVLPIRYTVLFPGMVLPLAIGSASAVAAVRDAVRGGRPIGVVLQIRPSTIRPRIYCTG
jgi:ATP-dependent Lon protease